MTRHLRIHSIAERARGLRALLAVACAALVLAWVAPSSAQVAGMPREMEDVGVDEHLGGTLPLDAAFRDHTGKAVKLGDFFGGKRPVVLTFAYHSCPVVCSMILNNAAQGLRQIEWTIGQEFDVVTISIDPNESLEKAAQKRTSILNEYARAGVGNDVGWHFLVGDAGAIDAAKAAAGFRAQYDADQKQWAHPSVVMIATPDGKMARYLYGLEFPNDLRLGLLEASNGRTMSTVDKLILYCYHYDPKGGKYVLVAQRVMQVGGGAVAVVLLSVLGAFWSRELLKIKEAKRMTTAGGEA